MMEEDLFSDFAILYRTLHSSRFKQKNDFPDGCIFETYHLQSLESGSRLRSSLSSAVINALVGYPNGIVSAKNQNFKKQTGLANGFIQNPHNLELREQIASGRIAADTFYAELLRLIYRFLFLIVTEERDLVYPETRDEEVLRKKQIYYRYYSIERLRKLAGKLLYADNSKDDLWEGMKSTFMLFENKYYGEKLGIQALSSGIFATDALRTLMTLRLDNCTLIDTIAGLCFFVNNQTGQTVRVNYSDLDVEEFGSVYEGLLEYSPAFNLKNETPHFQLKEGKFRSDSGSHYTPEELCKPLIQYSLEYILEERLLQSKIDKTIPLHRIIGQERETAIRALLGIKVCDVACGSGHLLLSAARRIALEVARLYTGEEQPNPVAMRQAMRIVIKNCIYGVDKNPLAVELCKVALWLEAHNPGEPLNFLDHHIKCGDSIVGLGHKDELMNGIPDEAFKVLPEDDKEIAKLYRTENKKGAGLIQQIGLFENKVGDSLEELIKQFDSLNQMQENTPEQVAEKERQYRMLMNKSAMQRLRTLADMQVAQFFVPKTDENKNKLVTNKDYFEYLRGGQIPMQLASGIIEVFTKYQFFHWFLEFPEVFTQGGFDCIIGNPPFLGGQKLSGAFGNSFLKFVKYAYKPAGAVDLVTYFFRRIFNILRPNGFQSLVSTNTISQGSAREGGLDVICSKEGVINHAVRSMRWPGDAAVEISLVTIHKGEWSKDIVLDKKKVERITPYLDDSEVLGNPYPLKQNAGKSFQGSIVLGKGFVLTPEEAEVLITKDPRNKDVLFPYLNGEDLNNDPEQKPSRWVINFFDWTEEKARTYPDCFEIVERLVKPERQRWKLDENGNEIVGTYALRKPLPQKWWIYGEKRPALYETISKVDQVMVVPLVSKYTSFDLVPTKIVYMHKLAVILFENFSEFGVLSSTLHNIWCWKNSSTLGAGTLNYSTTDCFETFPFPITLNNKELETVSRKYNSLRKKIMCDNRLGMTKLYNQFHNDRLLEISNLAHFPSNGKEFEKIYGKENFSFLKHLCKYSNNTSIKDACRDILELRELYCKIDISVLNAYGWSDISLKHDFYEVDYLPENDRVRFTIHPNARKEILRRLLLLNHEQYSKEQESLPSKQNRRIKIKNDQSFIDLFSDV
ncbi:restriction endonuclease [Bacteroides fragilis]|nr:DNA methyltransferase [Bacteroides fragilis]MCB6708381.1 restriction endonuclease [Bacteroides fragilis]MCQ5049623.1 restriction endonuclease [Bacteroides fragilis]MCS2418232.1 restriction endonuclease [Bacteroides fragilis]